MVLLAALGFATKAIIIKLAYADSSQIDAISLLALRMLFSLPFFLVVGVWQNRKTSSENLTIKQWLAVIALDLMGYYIASYLDFVGLQMISAGLERVILFIYPTFVVILSAIVFNRKITNRVILALLLSYAGMVLVFIEHLSIESSGLMPLFDSESSACKMQDLTLFLLAFVINNSVLHNGNFQKSVAFALFFLKTESHKVISKQEIALYNLV